MTAHRPAIAIFIRTLKSGGGAQRAMVRFASGLARRGYPVTVLSLVSGNAFDAELDPAIRRVTLGSRRLAWAVPAVAGWLRRERPATLFTTEPASNLVCILASRMACIGTRVVIREGLFPSVARRESPHRSTRIAYRLAPWIYPKADGIIAIASEMAADLAQTARVDPERVTTIAVNPVVTPQMLAAAQNPPPHPWLADGGSPVILAVGRFSRQKDFGVLIEAFARVRAEFPCRLLLVGDGEERATLEAAAAASGHGVDIAMPGFMSEPFAAMRACAVFVLSSRYEGLPNVLIEAVACGAPIVSTDCPSGPADVLDGGRWGRLVPVGDAGAMAEAIADTIDFPPDRAALAARGMDFTVERSLDRYVPVLFPSVEAVQA